MKICNVPTAYVLLNSDLGSDESIIADIKRILSNEGVDYEVQGVYGVYDIVLNYHLKMLKNYEQLSQTKLEKLVKYNQP